MNLSGSYNADSVSLDYMEPQKNSTVEAGDWINFQVFIPDSEAASITELGVYHRHGQALDNEDHAWEEITFAIEDLETEAWISLSGQLAEPFNSDSLLVMGLVVRSPSASDRPSIYIDNITFTNTQPTGISQVNDEIPQKYLWEQTIQIRSIRPPKFHLVLPKQNK